MSTIIREHQQNDVLYLQDAVKALCEEAVTTARSKLIVREQEKPLEELFTQRNFFEHFKYALTKDIVDLLVENNSHVEAVYLTSPSGNPDENEEAGGETPAEPTIHLLLKVDSPSAALGAFAESLERALLENLKELPTKMYAERDFVLAVNIVSAEDVAQNRGYAVLLRSIYAPPLKVWER